VVRWQTEDSGETSEALGYKISKVLEYLCYRTLGRGCVAVVNSPRGLGLLRSGGEFEGGM
jgi:hypothetical protein